MGQNVSQPQGQPTVDVQAVAQEEPARRRGGSSALGAIILDATRNLPSEEAGGLLNDDTADNLASTRSMSRNRLSRLLSTASHTNDTIIPATPHRSALHRSRTTFTNIFRRPSLRQRQSSISRAPGVSQSRSSYMRASGRDGIEEQEIEPPRLPSIDRASSFLERDMFTSNNNHDGASSSSQRSRRTSTLFGMRRNTRSDLPLRRWGTALRRHRSPAAATRRTTTGEDQAVLLSQLLSAAAAATAATLMGDDHQALNEAQSLSVGTGIGDLGGSGEDGSFEGFLRALQSGRIASALRQSGEAPEGTDLSSNGSLNFFRMFRFGSPADAPMEEASDVQGVEGRMIPIIIVGIRSISPNSNSDAGPSNDLPPFLDALTSLASSAQDADEFDNIGQDSIDTILRPPHNGTSFRHRRRASLGGFGAGRRRVTDYYDDYREQRSPDRRRERPWSVASSLSNELRPPPATPASPSPELSRIPSRNSTPSHSRPASIIANSLRELSGESRRNSVLHRSASSPLAIHTEETVSVHSAQSSDNLLRQPLSESQWDATQRHADALPPIHYPRFASGHPRRNGVVEPDNLASLSRPQTSAAGASNTNGSRNDSRSWIIYVLGGSYPENHPILTTPSLFSDNPTYEDMMLLSALLGPAKAPVASEEDVNSAGGIFHVIATSELVATPEDTAINGKMNDLVAVAAGDTNLEINPARIALEAGHRCLVCLCDFEIEEVLRRLGKCGHLFHQDCIDHWLTQGRNSCPLCRGEGVEEKPKAESSEQGSEPVAATG